MHLWIWLYLSRILSHICRGFQGECIVTALFWISTVPFAGGEERAQEWEEKKPSLKFSVVGHETASTTLTGWLEV